jgi:hypothetical protein
LLPDITDCFNCLVGYGFSPDEITCDFDPDIRLDEAKWNLKIKKFRQQDLQVLEIKKGNGLRRDWVREGFNLVLEDRPLPKIRQQPNPPAMVARPVQSIAPPVQAKIAPQVPSPEEIQMK